MYGKKLKQIRKHLDLTQDKMAELFNISARTYTSYERNENKPPYSMLVDLCKSQNVNLNWFIADIGEMFNSANESSTSGHHLNYDALEEKMEELLRKHNLID